MSAASSSAAPAAASAASVEQFPSASAPLPPPPSSSAAPRQEPLFIADDFTLPLSAFAIPPHYSAYLSHVLLPHGLIQDRVDKLAADIGACYAAGGPGAGGAGAPASVPHILVVLKGGNEFAGDLARALRARHAHAGAASMPFTMDFIRVKSYAGTQSTGAVAVSGIDLRSVAGRDLVLAEDIIDTGLTMTKLLPQLRAAGARSVRVAALLEKRTPHACGFRADFVGFSVPDAFVVGYNLDYNEAFREMPHICVINQAGIDYFRAHPLLQSLN